MEYVEGERQLLTIIPEDSLYSKTFLLEDRRYSAQEIMPLMGELINWALDKKREKAWNIEDMTIEYAARKNEKIPPHITYILRLRNQGVNP